MSQMFFKEMDLINARLRRRQQLRRMDKVLFPKGDRSLLDESLSPDQAETAIIQALEARLHQGTVMGNLISYLLYYAPGCTREELELLTVPGLFAEIAKNRDAIRHSIQEKEGSANG